MIKVVFFFFLGVQGNRTFFLLCEFSTGHVRKLSPAAGLTNIPAGQVICLSFFLLGIC